MARTVLQKRQKREERCRLRRATINRLKKLKEQKLKGQKVERESKEGGKRKNFKLNTKDHDTLSSLFDLESHDNITQLPSSFWENASEVLGFPSTYGILVRTGHLLWLNQRKENQKRKGNQMMEEFFEEKIPNTVFPCIEGPRKRSGRNVKVLDYRQIDHSEKDNIYKTNLSENSTKRNILETMQESCSPILRGVFTIESDGTGRWQGFWGETDYSFDNGTSVFPFAYSSVSLPSEAQNRAGLPKCLMSGYFMLSSSSRSSSFAKQTEKEVVIKFCDSADSRILRVEGYGKNKFGNFSLSGTFNPGSKVLACRREYQNITAIAQ